MKTGVVITAGGFGNRMNAREKKQFIPINGAPIIAHTIRVFNALPVISCVIVVVPADDINRVMELPVMNSEKVFVTKGGARRQDSVLNGLRALCMELYGKEGPDNERDIILVHDGVRPCITPELIHNCIRAAKKTGAAVPGLTPIDTIKKVTDGAVDCTLERSELIAVQTPQTFRISLLWSAFEAFRDADVTDDAMLVELLNTPIAVVPGEHDNIKITYYNDLNRAAEILRMHEEKSV